MAISFDNRVRVPDEVLMSGLQGESVLLNLDSERYFGLNEVGTRILTVLTSSPSIQTAYEALLDEFEVEGDVLRHDLTALIEQLLEQGLVEIASE